MVILRWKQVFCDLNSLLNDKLLDMPKLEACICMLQFKYGNNDTIWL